MSLYDITWNVPLESQPTLTVCLNPLGPPISISFDSSFFPNNLKRFFFDAFLFSDILQTKKIKFK